jgi:hypothetical protein
VYAQTGFKQKPQNYIVNITKSTSSRQMTFKNTQDTLTQPFYLNVAF